MPTVLHITPEQVASITSTHLFVDLLRRLLHAEAMKYGIAGRGVLVPAQITVGDAGEDGRIEWAGGPDNTDYLPNRITIFQCKATRMAPAACAAEVKARDGTLKLAVQQCLDASGAYVVFCTDKCTGKNLGDRIAGIKRGIAEATGGGYPNAVVDFYDANKISSWLDKHPGVAAWALEALFNRPLAGLQSWQGWSQNPDLAVGAFQYVNGEMIDGRRVNDVARAIADYVAEPRHVARLVGLSGLGKTRLALEMFRPPAGDGAAVNTDAVVYAGSQVGTEHLFRLLSQFRDERLSAIVVIDDCDLELHRNLANIARHPNSQFSLLTLDFDPSATDLGDHYVELNRLTDAAMKALVRQAYQAMPDHDVSKIIDFAQGFPSIAVRLGDDALTDAVNVRPLQNDVILRRLVWGRTQPDLNGQRVIATCAMFDNLGVTGRVQDEMSFAAESCGVSSQEFYRWVKFFERRQVIQTRGDFIQVLPKPLALRLAADGWSDVHPDTATAWFNGGMPVRMATTLCDQLRMLNFNPNARDLVARLCGDGGPFRNPEVLNTEWGSRCFRSLVETNPIATAECLESVFGDWTTDELRRVISGRRSLVWALEKLCFRKETFGAAARLLLAFGAAENESWGNNASGQFMHIYQLYLSGTEVDGDTKLKVVDEALRAGDEEKRALAIKALDHALTTHHFSRASGAEEQGAGPPLKDWQPKSPEAAKYYEDVLERLAQVAVGTGPLAYQAQSSVASNARGMAAVGLVDKLKWAIEKIRSTHDGLWVGAIEQLAMTLNFDGDRMSPEYRSKVQSLYDSLLPDKFKDRLRFYVSELPWDFFHEENFNASERATVDALTALARESADKFDEFLSYLPNLLEGEQRQFFVFGKVLGETVKDFERFIAAGLDILTQAQNPNPSLLGAFLSGLQGRLPKVVDGVLNQVREREDAIRFLPDLTRLIKISPGDIQRIASAVEEGKLSVRALQVFSYGSVIAHLEPIDMAPLFDWLTDKGSDGGWVAIELMSFYLHGKPERAEKLHDQVRKALMIPSLLQTQNITTMASHHFEVLALKLLAQEDGEEIFAAHIAQEIVNLTKLTPYPHNLDHSLNKIVPVLLNKHLRTIWPIISEAIANGGPISSFHLENLLGERMDRDGRTPPLFQLPLSFLTDWCERAPDVAPAFIARSAPMIEQNGGGGKSWTPIARYLIDKHGAKKSVLSGISANINTFSSWGSLVPYYQQYLAPLDELKDHPIKLVRDFAKAETGAMKRRIADEKKRNEEHDLGIF